MAQVINLLAAVTLIEMMVATGLSVSAADIVGVARDWRLLIRAAIANYLIVPAIAILLLMLFDPHPLVAVGFLIAAVCPGAPFGPPFTALARGNVVVSVGLMVILAGSSAVAAPLLLKIMLPLMVGDQVARIDVARMIGILLGAQLLPLCVGLATRELRPALADRLERPLNRLSTVLNLATFGLIIWVQFGMLSDIRLVGYAGMLVLVLVSVLAGWSLGGPGSANRRAMAMATSVRNVGVAMVIATGSFAGTPAVTAATAFAIFQTVVMAVVALAWSRVLPAATHIPVTSSL